MSLKPKTMGAYLDGLRPDRRAALQKLRKAILALVPDAQECISYGMPAFKYRGRMLVGFASAKNHCSFYPWSGTTVAANSGALKGYSTTKAAVHFQPEKPLSAALLRKLVKYRIAENAAKDRRYG